MPDESDRWKPWTIKNIPANVRQAAINRAKADGLEIGEWMARAIQDKIKADRRMPVPAEQAPRPVPAAVTLDRLERITAQVVQLAAAGDAVPESIRRTLYARYRAQMLGKGAPEPQLHRQAAPLTVAPSGDDQT